MGIRIWVGVRRSIIPIWEAVSLTITPFCQAAIPSHRDTERPMLSFAKSTTKFIYKVFQEQRICFSTKGQSKKNDGRFTRTDSCEVIWASGKLEGFSEMSFKGGNR